MTNKEILKGLSVYDTEVESLSKAILNEQINVSNLIRRLLKLMEYREKEKERILVAICNMENNLYRKVLIETYVNNTSAVKLRQEINYSLSRTYVIIEEAEKRLKL